MIKQIIAFISCILIITGCTRTYESQLKTEKATIVQLAYLPSSTGSDFSPGITSNGDVAFSMTTVTMPEQWAVVFRCSDHNQVFALRGKDIYTQAKVGETVTLEYVDILQETKDGIQVIDHHTKNVIFPKDN